MNIRSIYHIARDLTDALLLDVQVALVRLGERLLAYADPTPDFPGDEEDTHA